MNWLKRWKRIRETKKLAKRMMVLNEQQRIEALHDRHPVQRANEEERT